MDASSPGRQRQPPGQHPAHDTKAPTSTDHLPGLCQLEGSTPANPQGQGADQQPRSLRLGVRVREWRSAKSSLWPAPDKLTDIQRRCGTRVVSLSIFSAIFSKAHTQLTPFPLCQTRLAATRRSQLSFAWVGYRQKSIILHGASERVTGFAGCRASTQ